MDINDQKTISPTARGWAVFFSVLLGMVMLLVLFSITLQYTLFNEEFFKGILIKQGFFEQLPVLAAESAVQTALTNNQNGEATGNMVASMNTEQLALLINSVLPENYLQSQVESNIDSVFDFINLKSTGMNLVIDMLPVKERLLSAEGQQAIINFINTLPECTDEEVQAIIQSQNQQDSSSSTPLCKPPEAYMTIAIPKILASILDFAQTMPDQMNMTENQSGIAEIRSSTPFKIYMVFRFILFSVPFVAGALGLFILMLTLRSGKTLFMCWGVPMLVSGIIGGLASAATLFGGKMVLRSAQTTGTPFDSIILGSVNEAIREFSMFGIILGAGVIMVGVIFLLLSRTAKQ